MARGFDPVINAITAKQAQAPKKPETCARTHHSQHGTAEQTANGQEEKEN